MRQILFIGVICLSVATGCSSHTFVRDDLRQELGLQVPQYQERDIKKLFGKKINLPKPFSVAVYFKTKNTRHGKEWRWTLADKQKVVKALRESVSEEYVSRIFLIDENLAVDKNLQDISDGEELGNIRMAAARYRADSVMVVDGVGAVDTNPNRWGTTYLLVLPTLFVNGSTVDSYFAINATLWDVRNEVLYMSLSSEGEINKKYPAFWGDDDKTYIETTKQLALLDLQRAMQEDLKGFR